ncbi:MAG: hypothetical protein N2037_13675, partial [Acidimicrobiales bacterium]|nr:hypothetical protein [Acidimicrobiales bacterium]
SRHFGFLCARAVTTGFAVYLMASMVRLRAPTVVGLWFALWSIVPGIGYVLAALPLVAAAAVRSLPLAAILFAGSVVLQILDLRFVQKPIEHATLRIGPASTLLAVVFGVQLYGFGGAIVVLYLIGMMVAIGRELRGGEDRHDLYTQLRRLLNEQDDLLDEHRSSTLPRELAG